MSRQPPGSRSFLLSVATLGMAFVGPLALFSGLWVFATLWAGSPRALLAVFLVAAGGTTFFTLLYAAVHVAQRADDEL